MKNNKPIKMISVFFFALNSVAAFAQDTVPAPSSELTLLRDNFFTEYFGRSGSQHENFDDQTLVECNQKQVPVLAALVNKVALQYGKNPSTVMQNITLSANTNITPIQIPDGSDEGTLFFTFYDYSCSTTLVSQSENIHFVKRTYDIPMANPNDLATCNQVEDELRLQTGYIASSSTPVRSGGIFHRTWTCVITSMSLILN